MIPTRYINAGPMAAQANPGAAMAAGQATAQIGHAIEQVGETASHVVGQIRRADESGKIIAFMADADKQAGEFANSLATRHDTDAWPQEWQDKSAALRDQAKALGLSPDGMARLDGEMTQWGTSRAIQFETQALHKGLGMAKARWEQGSQYYAARGDKEGWERTQREAVEGGIISPVEAEAAEMHYAETTAGLDLQKLVEGNPQGLLDQDDETILKTVKGATLNQVAQAKRQAKGEVKERAFDTVEAAQDDIISGKITTPEMIDQNPRYAGLRPTVRERLKHGLQQRQLDEAEGRMATPEAQAEVVGKVSSLLSGWNPKAEEEADLQYAEIQGQINRLPEGSAMKAELGRQARAIRTGAWAETKTHADAAFKSLDDYDKQQAEKLPAVGKIPTADIVAKGFLKDPEKLQRLGFSEGQAKDIQKAAADPALGQAKFNELWKDRTGGSVKASKAEIEGANALRLGHAETPWDDPDSPAGKAKAAHYQQAGERRAKLADFLKLNPKASPAEIDEKILGIAGEQTTRNLRSGLYDAKPERHQTSSVNIKLSNYGYASDSTPDSNSARGIGHADNKLEDGKSAAISKSLADRLNLKTGDEVEIETTKGKFRVRYDDTVPATDSRTGDLPETIDIYRKDGANNWGGKVTKITKV